MTVVALVSAGGSSGATTLACALGAVWPEWRGSAVVAECDPYGGVLAARFGLSPDLGMTSLVLALRGQSADAASVDDHVQQLPGGLTALVGPVGADAGLLLDRELATVAGDLGAIGADLLVDCGRLGSRLPGQERILSEANHVILLVEPEAGAIGRGRWAVDRLTELRRPGLHGVGMAVAGRGAFDGDDIARALGVRLAAVIPRDRVAATVLRGEPGRRRALAGSTLVGAARRLASDLASNVDGEDIEVPRAT